MKTVKGIELPVNVLVIIAVAVLVMLGLIAIYFANPGNVLAENSARNAACSELQSRGCDSNTANIPFKYLNYTNLYNYCQSKCKDYATDARNQDLCCKTVVCAGACPNLPAPQRIK
ncbi:MAG: hypothetical protein QXU82_01405 [Candidatus Aenigmatarchaeota archaeon]